MSLFSSFIIDPVVRQARRFSGTQPVVVRDADGRPLLLSHVNRSSPTNTPHDDDGRSSGTRSPAVAAQNAPAMSQSLPADDGMCHLRARIHQIQDLNIREEDKARMMHGVMSERYNYMRPTSPSSFVSHDRPFTPTSGTSVFSEVHVSSPVSAASDPVDPENPFNLRPGDTEPTYRSRPAHHNPDATGEDEEFEQYEDDVALGCQHYKRNVKVQCFECRRWHTCRHCHDAVEDHNLNRVMTKNMLCMACGVPQQAGDYCVECGTQAACYYCDTCKLWDNNSTKKIYHCADCGICRRGEGLGKDYIHCKICNVCISIAHATSHRCIERATDCDCPICGEWLFNSSTAVVSMPCGHYLHKGCYNQYMETAYKCPTCKKSAVNMELQWQKLTLAIESQPMPEQFADTRAIIQCNDCSARSSVKYHWLGNKCNTCDSYNTNELRMLNGPESEQNANAILDAEVDLNPGTRSPLSVASPATQPLRSPRYYFQPDEPEQTWLPDQLPSFPFQMPQIPQFPGMPQIPQFPGMPQIPQFAGMPQFPQFPGIPQFPGMPQFPQMPQMPDPYDMLERVRRSFDHYLNPTGEVPNEAVPIIDLDMDDEDLREEVQATDGTTVILPSLPQYVLERFTQSITPLKNYLTPTTEHIPQLNLDDIGEVGRLRSWGLDRRAHDEDEEYEEDDDESSVSSEESGDEEDEDDGDAEEDDTDFQLPGHR
ncbi:zf-CHY-domain-containing protein [Massarina eburnea CBS 473.64]|uniref:Zf-CHY-domain-containing protein n=1 Tax=Massarina eburnea CBS 473.64 TaxID=1395130 RepID=A0A6A6RN19_9PLEO|nr:zf-CHY-domain-containing protein [Massarina eburnea CBS 473.64]